MVAKSGRVRNWICRSGKSREVHAGKVMSYNIEIIHTKSRVL